MILVFIVFQLWTFFYISISIVYFMSINPADRGVPMDANALELVVSELRRQVETLSLRLSGAGGNFTAQREADSDSTTKQRSSSTAYVDSSRYSQAESDSRDYIDSIRITPSTQHRAKISNFNLSDPRNQEKFGNDTAFYNRDRMSGQHDPMQSNIQFHNFSNEAENSDRKSTFLPNSP